MSAGREGKTGAKFEYKLRNGYGTNRLTGIRFHEPKAIQRIASACLFEGAGRE